MVNAERLLNRESDLAYDLQDWAAQTVADPGIRAIARQRDRTLCVWCEGSPCPDAARMTAAFSEAIYQRSHALPASAADVSRLVLYGRSGLSPDGDPDSGTPPEWTVRLEIQPHQIRPTQVPAAPPRDLVEAIETRLAALGQSVDRLNISIRDLEPERGEATDRRLWILCEADYTPDAAQLARPIATELRDLNLEGFRDAVLIAQVSGETEPEWMLRIDLTPPEQTIRRWAQWGDVAAIAYRLERQLVPIGLQVSAMLRDSTLHVVCSPQSEGAIDPASFPAREDVVAHLESALADLSPRGILGATVYGVEIPYEATFPTPSAPQWVTWLDLPAKQYPSLEISALELARAGNLEAIAFSLDRLLNPNLRDKLATGGQHVDLRRQHDLLYVAVEAPMTPDSDRTHAIVSKFFEQIETRDFSGVRLYGRRSGQRQPDWDRSIELAPSLAPEPEAPDASIVDESADAVEPTSRFTTPFVTTRPVRPSPLAGLRRLFCSTGLFADRPSTPSFEPARRPAANFSTALVWGAVGAVLTVQADWIASEILGRQAAREAIARGDIAAEIDPNAPDLNLTLSERRALETELQVQAENDNAPLPQLDAASDEAGAFDSRQFIDRTANRPLSAANLTPADRLDSNAIETEFPTLNSEQMDRQIALYAQYIADYGVPDVLIVGSSRALRGSDPGALEAALAEVGYRDLRAFNLGINGATAQVVEMLLTQVLAADQLPPLIVWADGARALNSGREDRTFEAIASSPGYAQIRDGFRPIESDAIAATDAVDRPSFFEAFHQRYRDLDDRLTRGFADHSATYAQRDRLQENLRDAAVSVLTPDADRPASVADASTNSSRELGNAALYSNGFLAFADRFTPATYYENFTRVAGSYDSDYRSFQLRGIQSISLTNIADTLRSRQIELVFVNLPLTQAYLDDTRRNYERQFSSYMLQMSKTLDFAFRDFAKLWPEENELFSDPSHLNRYGAQVIAERLAQSPMIPWEILTDDGSMPSTQSQR